VPPSSTVPRQWPRERLNSPSVESRNAGDLKMFSIAQGQACSLLALTIIRLVERKEELDDSPIE
jgi:hypothetical protein